MTNQSHESNLRCALTNFPVNRRSPRPGRGPAALAINGATWCPTALGPDVSGPSKTIPAARALLVIESDWGHVWWKEGREREREREREGKLSGINGESKLATWPVLVHPFFLQFYPQLSKIPLWRNFNFQTFNLASKIFILSPNFLKISKWLQHFHFFFPDWNQKLNFQKFKFPIFPLYKMWDFTPLVHRSMTLTRIVYL